MNAELREKLTPAEAAAKLRAYRHRVANNEVDSDDFLKSVGACYPVLVDAYLEQNPADDEEPIAREWLVEIGGRLSPFLEGKPCDYSEEWYCDFDCDVEGGLTLTVWNDGTVYLGNERLLRKRTTRRQLRDLLRVMGGK